MKINPSGTYSGTTMLYYTTSAFTSDSIYTNEAKEVVMYKLRRKYMHEIKNMKVYKY